MATIRKNNRGLQFLLALWGKYGELTPWHEEWARLHIQVLAKLPKEERLYSEGDRQQHIYLVVAGILAREVYDPETGKRHIISMALPGMALMTTAHLYSTSPSKGDLVTLRPNSMVIRISYRHVKAFEQVDGQVNTLINVLSNKKRKQLAILHRITLGATPSEACTRFFAEMPDLRYLLSQQEIADLLGISRSTVKRVLKNS